VHTGVLLGNWMQHFHFATELYPQLKGPHL
jgi:hypothetical protein